MILVVGAGISGAVLAERYAALGKKVLLIDKREHLGGNCYDMVTEEGLLIPLYGPHFFHTSNERVWDYVNRFSAWSPYEHRVLSSVDGNLVPIPVNITTVNRLFGTHIENSSEMDAWLARNTENIAEPANSEESALNRVGRVLYEKMFKNYTRKQWDMDPSELDAQVMNRIPVRRNFDDRYFTDTYQAMPTEGYAQLFRNITDNANIELQLGVDFFAEKFDVSSFEKVFFTGRIDQYFANRISDRLEYRSLRFEYETHDLERYQQSATINYPNDYDYTRITEPKQSTGQSNPKTIIIKEYPTWEGEPYYPVFSQRNQKLYAQYQNLAKEAEKDHVYFAGRLANYRYFNMDAAFENALSLFEDIEQEVQP